MDSLVVLRLSLKNEGIEDIADYLYLRTGLGFFVKWVYLLYFSSSH